MKIIGITGPTGSGKSLFSRKLSEHSIPCIDADALYHSMLIPPSACLDAIADVFGDDLILPDGSLDRSALSHKVFSNPDALSLLNRTVLPLVLDKIRERLASLEREGNVIAAVDAPTLIESGFYRECDLTITIIAPCTDRIKRIMERDGISQEKAIARISAQRKDDFYTSVSDITLINDGDEKAFEENTERLIEEIKYLLQKEEI